MARGWGKSEEDLEAERERSRAFRRRLTELLAEFDDPVP